MNRHNPFKYAFLLIAFCALFFLLREESFSRDDRDNDSHEISLKGFTISPQTDTAIVVAEKDDDEHSFDSGYARIIDLSTLLNLAKIPIGKKPNDIAVDYDLNLVLITNKESRTISVLDLLSFSLLKTIPLRKKPGNIAINQMTHIALVTHYEDEAVSAIDIRNHNVLGTIHTEGKPKDAAIDPELNLGLIIVTPKNSETEERKSDNRNKNEEDHSTIAVVDLNTYQTIMGISHMGHEPRSVVINPETHVAVVSGKDHGTMTLLDLRTWQSRPISVEEDPVDVAVNPLDNRALVINDDEETLRLIDPDSGTVVKRYRLNIEPKRIAVNNYTNMAAVMHDKAAIPLLIQLPNPLPEIASLIPDNAIRESGEKSIAVEGKKFIRSSVAYFDGKPLPTTFTDNHNIQVTVPQGILSKAGNFPISVSNPAPEGGTSPSINFTVSNPVPSISVFEPPEAVAGATGVTVSIYGTGFFEDTEVYFNGMEKPATFISNTRLQLNLTAEDLKTPGIYKVITYNVSPGGGSSNEAAFVIKNPLELKIISPANGETINKAKVIVSGTFKSGSQDIGITVNGVIAEVKGNAWMVNNAPLSIGSNSIVATIKDSDGNSATATIEINTTDISQPVKLSSSIASGIAPLTSYFSVTTETSNRITSYQIDFEGDGVVDYTGPTFDNISHIYTSEGIFYPTLTVTDNQGNIYSDTIAVIVLSKAEIDALLQTKWEGMKEALRNKDVELGLRYFLESTRGDYRQAFNIIIEELPQIVAAMQEAEMVYAADGLAKYRIHRTQEIEGVTQILTYYIYFAKDDNGVWKINKF